MMNSIMSLLAEFRGNTPSQERGFSNGSEKRTDFHPFVMSNVSRQKNSQHFDQFCGIFPSNKQINLFLIGTAVAQSLVIGRSYLSIVHLFFNVLYTSHEVSSLKPPIAQIQCPMLQTPIAVLITCIQARILTFCVFKLILKVVF